MAYTFKHGDKPIDGYTIQRAVGKGGFGEVYYAISEGGREVAIKYLRDNPQIELRGVSHCINLKSPHLVSIFDVKKTVDGEYCIIMEYCSGPSLRDLLIAEPNGFEPRKAAFFVREIAKGLSYLHDHGIVHRDLKPGNLFYDDGYVKICDYGLSKFISVSRHSGQTASVGTVHYMAPEIGSGNYSRGVDIYALGVVLYEMLMGKVPFEGSSMAEVLMKHLTAQPELDDLPQPFGKVIRRALQKDPDDRYQTVDEMVDELLEVDEVRQSLAGFSTKSLEGAVRRGGAAIPSPIPSPNPAALQGGQPPFAQPVGRPELLPAKLRKKADRISRKMDAKMAKLAGKKPPLHPTEKAGSHPGATPPFLGGSRKKRILLSGIMSLGLALGLGFLVGAVGSLDVEGGVTAGMMVVAMSAGVVLSRSAIGWFGCATGPKWAQHFIRLFCAAPLMAVAAAPLLDSSHGEEGMGLWVGLVIATMFVRWEKYYETSSPGEMSFGRALWIAFGALICTAIGSALFNGRNEDIVLVGAGIAGAVSLIVQATSWWLPHYATRALGAESPADGSSETLSTDTTTEPPIDAEHAPFAQPAVVTHASFPAPPHSGFNAASPSVNVSHVPQHHPLQRWGVTRAFWGLLAFALMGGTIATTLYAAIAHDSRAFHTSDYHDFTAIIIASIAMASAMLFAIRRTGPIRQPGFWRETLRPLLICFTMIAIGASIVGIAREMDHYTVYSYELGLDHRVACVAPEGKAALITGLIMSSLLFLVLLGSTVRRPRPHSGLTAAVPSAKLPVQVGDPSQGSTAFATNNEGISDKAKTATEVDGLIDDFLDPGAPKDTV